MYDIILMIDVALLHSFFVRKNEKAIKTLVEESETWVDMVITVFAIQTTIHY